MRKKLTAFAVLVIVGTGIGKHMLVIKEDNDHYFKP